MVKMVCKQSVQVTRMSSCGARTPAVPTTLSATRALRAVPTTVENHTPV